MRKEYWEDPTLCPRERRQRFLLEERRRLVGLCFRGLLILALILYLLSV